MAEFSTSSLQVIYIANCEASLTLALLVDDDVPTANQPYTNKSSLAVP